MGEWCDACWLARPNRFGRSRRTKLADKETIHPPFAALGAKLRYSEFDDYALLWKYNYFVS